MKITCVPNQMDYIPANQVYKERICNYISPVFDSLSSPHYKKKGGKSFLSLCTEAMKTCMVMQEGSDTLKLVYIIFLLAVISFLSCLSKEKKEEEKHCSHYTCFPFESHP